MSLSGPFQVLILGLIPLFDLLFHLIRHLYSHPLNLFKSQVKIWFPNTLTIPCLELLSTGELKAKPSKKEQAELDPNKKEVILLCTNS